MKSGIYLVWLFLIFCACNKEKQADEATCRNIQNVSLSSNSPVSIGEPITFSAPEVGGYRIYNWSGPNNYSSQNESNTIAAAQLQNEGWYYLNLTSTSSYSNCQKIDSIYIDVQLLQGTPTCNTGNNTTTFNNLSTNTYSLIRKFIEPNYSQKVLAANGSTTSNLTVYFHTHWRSIEPEDGIYTTINVPVFDQADNDYAKVFITTTKNSVYWSSSAGQTVYINHIGSKLQIRFCNLTMRGNNGSSYTTVASSNIIEQ